MFPYGRDTSLFDSALDKPGTHSFQMNPNLAGIKAGKLKAAGETVLFYEGTMHFPLFRYGEEEPKRSVLGFADGHVGVFTAEKIPSLLWSASAKAQIH